MTGLQSICHTPYLLQFVYCICLYSVFFEGSGRELMKPSYRGDNLLEQQKRRAKKKRIWGMTYVQIGTLVGLGTLAFSLIGCLALFIFFDSLSVSTSVATATSVISLVNPTLAVATPLSVSQQQSIHERATGNSVTPTYTPTPTAINANNPSLTPTTIPSATAVTPILLPTKVPTSTYPSVYIPPSDLTIPDNGSGASAICNDGTYSYSAHRRGTCSHHGGVAQWLRSLPP